MNGAYFPNVGYVNCRNVRAATVNAIIKLDNWLWLSNLSQTHTLLQPDMNKAPYQGFKMNMITVNEMAQ